MPTKGRPDLENQRLRALERANETRQRRARLKKDVKAGRVSVVDVVLNPPDWAGTMTLGALLLCVPKVGRIKSQRILLHARLTPSKTLAGLNVRQRRDLAEQIRG